MPTMKKIFPCLWFDGQAEDAARFYAGVFEKNSRIGQISHDTEAGTRFTAETARVGDDGGVRARGTSRSLRSMAARCSSSTRRSRFRSL